MNKVYKIFFFLMLISFIVLGCTESDDSDDNGTNPQNGHPPPEMVASWIFQSVTVNGNPAVLDSVMEWLPATVQAKLHIYANSAYVFEEVNASGGQLWFESGFVFIDGVELDINAQLDSDGPTSDLTRAGFTLDSTTFTLEINDSGTVIFYTLTQ